LKTAEAPGIYDEMRCATLALALAVALGGGLGSPIPEARADGPGEETRLFLPPVAAGPPGTADLAERAVELVRSETRARGHRVVSEATLARILDGAPVEEVPDMEAADDALRRGQDLYLEFAFAEAAGHLESAASAFEKALPHTGDLEVLVDALVFLGTTLRELGREEDGRAAFVRVLSLDPTHALDETIHPPEVIAAFEAAREEAAARPSGRLDVASAPPLAEVFLDGRPVGRTPLTLTDVPVGAHALRLEMDGHQPFASQIRVDASGATMEIRLEPLDAGDVIEKLERELAGQGRRSEISEHAARLTRSVGADVVGILALSRVSGGYLMVLAHVDGDGERRVAWTVVDPDFLRAQAAARLLVESIEAAPGPRFVAVDLPEPALALDFERWTVGFSPAAPPGSTARDPATSRAGRRPLLWTGIAVGVLAAAAGGYALVSSPAAETPSYRLGIEAEVVR
jgi:tetratricopeptide (TPR) repeat protein